MTKKLPLVERSENRRRWAEALRSGEWKQHRSDWCSGATCTWPKTVEEATQHAHCCLSVGLCVVGKPIGQENVGQSVLEQFFGLATTAPFVTANDNDRKTFPEIAGMVEDDQYFDVTE